MDENLKTLNLKVLENTAAALRGNNFEAAVYGTGAEAASAVLALAGGKKVGLGGSVTLKTLGLPGSLEAAGSEIITMPACQRKKSALPGWRAGPTHLPPAGRHPTANLSS